MTDRGTRPERSGQTFYIYLIILVILTAIIISTGVYFNSLVSYIHNLEIKAALIRIDREESWNDYIRMVSKYRLYREIYTAKRFHKELTRKELEVALVIVHDDSGYNIKEDKKYKYTLPAAINLINLFRSYLGNPPLENVISAPSLPYYQVGLYLEKNNYYDQAITFFKKSLEFNDSNKDLTLLHMAYCYSIIGNYNRALNLYNQVLEITDNYTLRITCSVLLNYLNFFQQEIEQVKYNKPADQERYEVLFKLLAFNEALKELKKRETPPGPKEQFYKARCLEELGKKEEAITLYQNLIQDDYRSSFAREANRRILFMGLSEDRDVLVNLTKNNNNLIQDNELAVLHEISSLYPEAERLSDIIEKYPVTTKFVTEILYKEEKREETYNQIITSMVKKEKEEPEESNEEPEESWQVSQIHSFGPDKNGAFSPVLSIKAGENHLVGLSGTDVAGFTADGKLIWTKKYGESERISFMTAPVIRKGKVYLVSTNKKLIILNLKNGRETGRLDVPGGVTYGYTSQLFSEKLLVPGISGIFLYDFNRQKTEMLEYVDLKSPASPLLLENNLIVSSFVEQKIINYNKMGQQVWSFYLDNRSFQSPITDGRSLYIGDTKGTVYKISMTGQLEDTARLNEGITSRFLLINNRIIALLNNGTMYSIDTATLSTARTVKVDSSPDPTSYLYKYPVQYGEHVFIGTNRGTILVLDKKAKNLEETIKLPSGEAVTSAVEKFNRLYFVGNNRGDLFLFSRKKSE